MSIYTCKAIVMYINKLYTTQLITFISPFCTLSKLRSFHAPARRFLRLLITNYVYKNAIIIFILSPYGPPKKRSFHCIVVPRIWCHIPVMYINELHISHTKRYHLTIAPCDCCCYVHNNVTSIYTHQANLLCT